MRANLFFLLLFVGFTLQAENKNNPAQDSIRTQLLEEVIVSSSTKETNDLRTLPASVSIITPQMIEGQKIISVKNLSMIIPNFYLFDYGSRLSVPIYIRGIGERSSGQSVGMYMDNIPYMNKSVFDFDLMDIQRIEVLRGPQGTLYGRNAMSGIINAFTNSAFQDHHKFSLSAGNYNLLRAKMAVSKPLSETIGLSVNGYYAGNDGYFTNDFLKEKADAMQSGGTRVRLDWKFAPNWVAQFNAGYDYSDQSAFPYGEYQEGEIAAPSYDYAGSYRRQTASGNANVRYSNDRIVFNSSTGFLYFDDKMKMDLDYGPENKFTINQWQNERSWTEELTLKSNSKSNYQWSFGVFGFYTGLKTDALTTMGDRGIATILQPEFDKISQENPRAPQLTVMNEAIPIPGLFKTPTLGGAVFHQSTYNNLLIEGLSATAGVRLDYEKTKLNYNTDIAVDIQASFSGRPLGTETRDTLLTGKESVSFTEVLPKFALKYEFDKQNYIYATVANGYKTGGYNIQMFADIAQNALRQKYDASAPKLSVEDVVPYKPEYSWNYEIGYKGEVVKNRLFAEIAAFYIDVKDVQITDFVESGQGRILKNAGKARSAGAEVSLTAILTDELRLALNYGFTKATFTDYQIKDGETVVRDYNGNYLPFAPQNTFSANVLYNKRLQNKWLDGFNVQAQYNGAGKIHWTEENDISQDFYGILNLKASLFKGIFELGFWTNNTLSADYAAFYFESMGRSLAQKGRPFTCGADFTIAF